MGLSGSVVQLNRPLSRCLCFGPGFRGRKDAFVVTGPEIGVGQSRERRRKVWIQLDRHFEALDGFLQVLVTGAIKEIPALQIGVVRRGIHTSERWPTAPSRLGLIER